MNFLVDAHLPRRVALRLRERGHDVCHTLDLPLANRTTDGEINDLSLRERRVVITKDSDFVDSLLLRDKPWKLLLITTGNIGNAALLEVLDAQLAVIVRAFDDHRYVELSRSAVIVHT